MLRKFPKKFLLLVALKGIVLTLFFLWSYTVKSTEQIKNSKYYQRSQEDYIDRNGIKVVVGHYIGNALRPVPNVTNDILNTNFYSPQKDAGANGFPVIVQNTDLIRIQQLYQINRFNLMASDRIPLNRSLPDYRRKRCLNLYDDQNRTYPKASVIIVFHNEAWSTLLRTVHSVLNRSPSNLIAEVLLIDDASNRQFLRHDLDQYVVKFDNVKVLRSTSRLGLIQARIWGAKQATGEALVFLDAHCECTQGWLPPLLDTITKNPESVACPIIDIINDETFAYVKSFELHWGAFNWHLQFRWFTLGGAGLLRRKHDPTAPFPTPTMAGGLYAVRRKYFFKMGAYDPLMRIWGGENLEMSFRLWLCGGAILIVPCSHVGHVFRKSSPYNFPDGINETLFGNLARVAAVWMDQWAAFYFRFNRIAREQLVRQNVTERQRLRQHLKCKDFKWYLTEIWPQHFFPMDGRFFGRIRSIGREACLVRPVQNPVGTKLSNQPMGLARLGQCVDDNEVRDKFVMTAEGILMTDDSLCLDAAEKLIKSPATVRITACSGLNRQKWNYNNHTKEMVHVTNGKCLDIGNSGKSLISGNETLVTLVCNGATTQKWDFQSVPWN